MQWAERQGWDRAGPIFRLGPGRLARPRGFEGSVCESLVDQGVAVTRENEEQHV